MLVESIRDSMPVSSALVSRRMALEQVSGLLFGARPLSPPSLKRKLQHLLTQSVATC